MGYTPNETRLLKVLLGRKGARTSSEDIARLHFRGKKHPQNARRSVVSVLNTLMVKTKTNGELYVICKTPRSGPYPIFYWVELTDVPL